MHAEHRLHGETLEQAILDHLARPASAFLGRLEDQVDRAIEITVLRQVLRRRQQHGGVAVVAAGVHLARVSAGMVEGVELLHGQRIHVGAQADGPATGTTVAPVHDADHPVVPRPRWMGIPQSARFCATRSAVRNSSKHSSGWA